MRWQAIHATTCSTTHREGFLWHFSETKGIIPFITPCTWYGPGTLESLWPSRGFNKTTSFREQLEGALLSDKRPFGTVTSRENQYNMDQRMEVSSGWWIGGRRGGGLEETYWFLSVTTGRGISSLMKSSSSIRLLAREMSIDVLLSWLLFTVMSKDNRI